MSAQVEIHKLSHRCNLVASQADMRAIEFQQKLQMISHTHLPQVLGELIEAHFASQLSDDAIVIIRKISFDIHLLATELGDMSLCHKLAQAIASNMLTQYASGDTRHIAVFANYHEYTAQHINHLLAPQSHRSWCYSQATAHQHLTCEESIITLLSEYLADLPQLAKRLQQAGCLEKTLTQIQPSQMTWLLKHWSGWNGNQTLTQAELQQGLRQYSQHAEFIKQCLKTSEQTTNGHFLRSYFLSLAQGEKTTESAESIQHKFMLFCVLSHMELIEVMVSSPQAKTNISLLTHDDLIAKVLGSIQEHSQHSADLRQTLQAVMLVAKGQDAKATTTSDTHTSQQQTEEQTSALWSEFSEVAGMALLLPTVSQLALTQWFELHDIKQALFTILQEQNVSEQQVWLDRLFTPHPDNVSAFTPALPTSPFPTKLLLGLHESTQQEILQQHGIHQLASLILAQFAARLSGLQLSSHSYLFTQFLQTQGQIKKTTQGIHIILAPIPLNLVLSMSGYSQWQGQLAWLQTPLSIEVQP